MELKKQLEQALEELKQSKKRKFNQTVDLIVNLQKIDLKKVNINVFAGLPHKIKEKKIAGFLEVKNDEIDTITPEEFKKYSNKKNLKKLIKTYDFFIAQASLMPKIATTFGRALGPAGKMPSPQLGIITNADNKTVSELKNKINASIKIKIKEASIKVPIGKQDMKNENLIENILSTYNTVIKNLPRDKENIKNIEIKFTMSKPIKIKIR